MQLSRITAVGASAAALFGSCCALPLLLLGLTGTVGFASVLAPYQKYFTVLTVIPIGNRLLPGLWEEAESLRGCQSL